ncbi:isochorismate synthase [Agrococcus jejuensis]|uniref:isochorismate synthase n=1 Tax=Agrococcus jejuensis TaxID=399736 RepID=UPI002F919B48
MTTRAAHGRLIAHADASAPLAFVRSGDGLVGVGEALRITVSGPDRIADAAAAWDALVAAAEVTDEVDAHGTGLVAFGTFAFADDSAAESVLIVPRIVLGRRGDDAWTTRIAVDDEPLPEPQPKREVDDVRVALAPGAIDPERYATIVGSAVAAIRAGELEKVVLARDLVGALPAGADLRSALLGLRRRYPDAITYAVDGLLGASPEMLVAARDGRTFTRVLAGTAARGATPELDGEAAEALAVHPKDVGEHRLAAESALEALRPISRDLATSGPYPLRLPNLWHLATDITGTLEGSVLDALAALHPTAAVAGTPRDVALARIAELEGIDRGRYAGPVGWLDASGGGEWAIALRGAQVAPDGSIRAFAGAGIVADSVPADELAETAIKLRPIVDAFGDPLPRARCWSSRSLVAFCRRFRLSREHSPQDPESPAIRNQCGMGRLRFAGDQGWRREDAPPTPSIACNAQRDGAARG